MHQMIDDFAGVGGMAMTKLRAGDRFFRSNCLMEAIKAKLRYGKSVRIVRMKSHDGLHHYGWYDKKSGILYDFAQSQVVKHWIQYLRFWGYIRQRGPEYCGHLPEAPGDDE